MSEPQSPPPRPRPAPAAGAGGALPVEPCPRCGAPIVAIRGSRLALCRVCGYKDDCC